MPKPIKQNLQIRMLGQLQQNQYLRIKLIQLQQSCCAKDDFYLQVFREQDKITQKVMTQLLIGQSKIKQLIRTRICNHYKEQYDLLADGISLYVNDVNIVIQDYMKAKQKLQKKAYQTNDLYGYYSNTLEECGKKFDQAQLIIQELNHQIQNHKNTIEQFDQVFDQKTDLIQQQNKLIESLQNQIQQLQVELQSKQKEISKLHIDNQTILKAQRQILSDEKHKNKKLQKQSQTLQRTIFQMQKLIQGLEGDLKKQNHQIYNQPKIAFSPKLNPCGHEIQINQLQKKLFEQQNNIQQLNFQNSRLNVQNKRLNHLLSSISQQRQKINLPSFMIHQNKYYKKLLKACQQKSQVINKQNKQIQYSQKLLRQNQKQNQQIVQLLKHKTLRQKQLQQDNEKLIVNIKLFEQRIQLQNQQKQLQRKRQIQYLRQSIISQNQPFKHQRQIQNLKKDNKNQLIQLSNLTNKYENLVKQYKLKKQRLNIDYINLSHSIHPYGIQKQNPKSTPRQKKNLKIQIQDRYQQKVQQKCQNQKELNQVKLVCSNTRSKKFNLQTFQQKTNPFQNLICSPKVGNIFNHNRNKW